jgi:GNAT superfamily N-acetyltransferase
MESNSNYILEWELFYKIFSKQFIDEPFEFYWETSQNYTNTYFFPFGFITCTTKDPINSIPYIRVVYILNEFRNQKIGSKMVNDLLKCYKKQGFKKVSVEPTIESVLFWEKLGFKKPTKTSKRNKDKFFKEL